MTIVTQMVLPAYSLPCRQRVAKILKVKTYEKENFNYGLPAFIHDNESAKRKFVFGE